MSGAFEQAKNICIRRLKDPSLALLICRLRNDTFDSQKGMMVPGPQTLDLLKDIKNGGKWRGDYWLQAIMAWHSGDYKGALEFSKQHEPSVSPKTDSADTVVEDLAFCDSNGLEDLQAFLQTTVQLKRQSLKAPARQDTIFDSKIESKSSLLTQEP